MEKIKNKLQAELDASTFEIAESENEEAQQPTTSGYITCEMIDWEQRRWQLATSFASHRTTHISFNGHPIRVALTAKEAIKEADELIEEYKKSLNTEEQQ